MTRFVCVRHGETLENRAGILQGQGGGPLSERGHAQAKRLAERLAPFVLDACYSSDQPRARETTEHLIAPHELTPLYVRALREVFVGTWQGKTPAQVALELPEEHAAWLRGEDIPRGGGERYEDVAIRVGACLGQIAEAFPNGHVLIVSHGAALRATVARLLGLSLLGLGGLHNASLSVFDYNVDPERPNHPHCMHVWNDTGRADDMEDVLSALLRRR